MTRFVRSLVAGLVILIALSVVGVKAWLELSGPFLEALPYYPFCAEANTALVRDDVAGAIELAEAGECVSVLERASERWDGLAATFERCVAGIWTGEADDGASLACAVASDLVVFGDVRDLTRQGLSWSRGEETDVVLISLSAAGVALALMPQAGAGASLLKVARKAGTLSDRLASAAYALFKRREWRALGGLLGDAGRISVKVGPARATRALAYADSAEDLRDVARFVETASDPLLGLKWGGKRVLRLTDDPELYAQALARGRPGLLLAAERGGAALLTRKPLVIAAAKVLYRDPAALLAGLGSLAAWLLGWLSWRYALLVASALLLVAALLLPRASETRRGPRRGSGDGSDSRRVWRAER